MDNLETTVPTFTGPMINLYSRDLFRAPPIEFQV
jgi:hypothetical protein